MSHRGLVVQIAARFPQGTVNPPRTVGPGDGGHARSWGLAGVRSPSAPTALDHSAWSDCSGAVDGATETHRYGEPMRQGAYRPALDGIRALAVAAVLWFHLGRLPGGNLGVDAFFVVSGWLITWKLLDEVDRDGGIDLRRFWTARARRLLPASLSVLVAVALLMS